MHETHERSHHDVGGNVPTRVLHKTALSKVKVGFIFIDQSMTGGMQPKLILVVS